MRPNSMQPARRRYQRRRRIGGPRSGMGTQFPREVTFRTKLGFYYQNTTTGPVLIIINPYDSVDFLARFQTFRSYRIMGWRGRAVLNETAPVSDATPYALLAPFYQAQVEVSSSPITPPSNLARAAELPQSKMICTRAGNARNVITFSWRSSDVNTRNWLPVQTPSVSDAYYNTGLIGFTDGPATYQFTGTFDIEFKDLQIV